MKKLLVLLLALSMVLSMVACVTNPTEPSGNSTNPSNNPTNPSTPAGNVDVTPDVDATSLGGLLWAAFDAAVAANPAATAEELANVLSANENIPFSSIAMPVEPGYLAGFNVEITEFDKAAKYEAVIGSIPFIGYVFDLAEGADVAAFITTLEENYNLRWVICNPADQAVIGSKGNHVFFVMCPDISGAEGGEESAEVIHPDVAEGTLGDALWFAFLSFMEANPDATTVDAAFMVTMDESVAELGLITAEMVPGYLPGFDSYEVTEFEECTAFMQAFGSFPFVGYVLKLEAGIDVQNYMADLKANSNPWWCECVCADQTVVGAYGNYVFFLMCPANL